MTFTVGLIGGIASGKSTALKQFRELGVDCFSADEIARTLLEPHEPVYQQIVAHIGKDYVLPNHQLDRPKLRKKLLNDSHFKAWLEQLTHPLIRERLLHHAQEATSAYCVLEIPLLKKKSDYALDRVLLIHTTPQRQQQFLKHRGLSQNEIKKILRAQVPESLRYALADDIIENTESIDVLNQKLLALHEVYRLNLCK